jgi:cyclic beta-1,2-glucan synthetase
MNAVDQRLVRRDAGLIQLFDPPFDKSPLNPGYIKGYIPGVRENGGQYTHGAIWTAMAFALMGENERAWELFALLNPIHHSEHAPNKSPPTKWSLMSSPRTSMPSRRTRPGRLDLVHRIRRLDVSAAHRNAAGRESGGRSTASDTPLPKSWTTCKIHYRYRQTVYHITITRLAADSADANQLFLDGKELASEKVPLVDDRREHSVELKVWHNFIEISSGQARAALLIIRAWDRASPRLSPKDSLK